MSKNLKILGFDIGISSIGWAYVENNELKDCGVRIFTKAEQSDGKSLALPRREARGIRRRLARRKARLKALKQIIAKEFGLNYADFISQDGVLPKAYSGKNLRNPYELRTLALTRKLEPSELARVILHIAKHRGYSNKNSKDSNDKKDKEKGKVLKAISLNDEQMSKYDTIGAYLFNTFLNKEKNEQQEKVRNRQIPKRDKEGNIIKDKNGDIEMENDYIRTMNQVWLKKELEIIFEKQKEFGFVFSPKFQDEILKIAFHQRPLKSWEEKIGQCIFYENEKRATKCCPSAWEFVALTKTINLMENIKNNTGVIFESNLFQTNPLQEIISIILEKGFITYKLLKEKLALPKDFKFKDCDYLQKGLKAEDIKFIEFIKLKEFQKALAKENLSFEKDREKLDSIATHIANTPDEDKLKEKLKAYHLKSETIENLSKLEFKAHINLSLKALGQILPFMREGQGYDKAKENAGLQELRKSEKSELLPPFCEYDDTLTNPVVKRAISEYRKVLNSLLKKYGKVHKINIELTREVGKSLKERQAIEKEQKENYENNQNAIKKCKELDLKVNGKNMLKIKLWLEQGEVCAYSGKKITIAHLKDEKALEIDHIYPYSRSFDDSYSNKVLVFVSENQNKGSKTPFEAFGKDLQKWQAIKIMALNLPKNKAKRILNENFKDKENEFKDRNLCDTSYIARTILNYTKDNLEFLPLSDDEDLGFLSGEKGSKIHAEATSGSLTSAIRHNLGFSKKDRENHLHHALDAIIVAFMNAKIIKAFADFRKAKAEYKDRQISKEEYKNKYFVWYGKVLGLDFRSKAKSLIDSIFVSQPPRKKVSGALHKESFYKESDFYKDYGGEAGVERALKLGKIRKIGTKIVSNGEMVRVDIFKKDGKFYAVPIYTMDFALGILPNKAVVSGKDNGIIKDWLEMDSNYEFCFSLFKNDLIKIQRKDMQQAELCYFVNFVSSVAAINVKKHDARLESLSENEKLLYTSYNDKNNPKAEGKSIGIQNLKLFEKWQVGILGNDEKYKVSDEKRQNIALKSTKKKEK